MEMNSNEKKKEDFVVTEILANGTTEEADDKSKTPEKKPEGNILVLATFILEVIIILFIVVLEYLLRWTLVFPIRKQNFTCSDPDINYRLEQTSFSNFAFETTISDSSVYALIFCVPFFVIIVGEIGVWAFSDERQKIVRVGCRGLKMPQVVRRLIRFLGVFFFGIVIVMIFCDVIKMMTGRLRPNFLELCKVNITQCMHSGGHGNDELCSEKDEKVIRHARTSFPSLFSAISAFAAVYISIYIHGALRTRSVRVLRPFLSLAFTVLALLYGLMEVGLHISHPLDVAAGLLLGVAMAFYLGCIVLHNFREYVPEKIVLSLLHRFLLDNQILEALMKESGQKLPFKITKEQDFIIPRARTSFRRNKEPGDDTDETNIRARMFEHLQKGLSETVDYYKERQNKNEQNNI